MRLLPRRSVFAATAVIAAVTLAGCAASEAPVPTESAAVQTRTDGVDAALAAGGWGDLSGADLVETLDQLPIAERPTDLIASVRSTVVQLQSADGSTREVPIEDGFYLSLAPYREQTHPCSFHSLTTCRGELAGEDVTIVVTDPATGEQIVDEATTTYDNGFVGVWLPRERALEITVTTADGAASTPVSTFADDPTCLTTLQLL